MENDARIVPDSADSFDRDGFGLLPWEGRAILLVDLDAFFASVEQLDHPAWRGLPVIVGGSPEKRGVVSTASYEARAFGVRSAMPSITAKRLCPDAIWTQGRFSRYREMSEAIMEALFSETPHVEQVSIDEAFADVTPNRVNRDHPVLVARRIQERVAALGVTCSIGVATSKALAKLASDMDKPRGLTVVYPGSEQGFIEPLPVRALSGIGAASEAKLRAHGIETLGDLYRADERLIVRLLGKNGLVMLDRVHGLEDAPVDPDDEVKSVSNEVSFAVDLTVRADIEAAIATMAAKVGRRLRRKGLRGRVLTLKVRFGDRSVHSSQRTLAVPTDDELSFMPELDRLLDELWRPGLAVRLVGVAVTGFGGAGERQQRLFEDEEGADEGERRPRALADERRRRGLLEATDTVRNRFGEGAVLFGRELRTAENTTGSSAKNPADYK